MQILLWAADRGLSATAVWEHYAGRDGRDSIRATLRLLAERYGLGPDQLEHEWHRRVQTISEAGRLANDDHVALALADEPVRHAGATAALLVMPDEEFLEALAAAERETVPPGSRRAAGDSLLAYAGEVLRLHDAPWSVCEEAGVRWVGDRGISELNVRPALRALRDVRLAGAGAHLQAALEARAHPSGARHGIAVGRACDAVEAVLRTLLAFDGSWPPPACTPEALFDELVALGSLPSWLGPLVLAPAWIARRPLDALAGPLPAGGAADIADAAIGASANAIALLARFLP